MTNCATDKRVGVQTGHRISIVLVPITPSLSCFISMNIHCFVLCQFYCQPAAATTKPRDIPAAATTKRRYIPAATLPPLPQHYRHCRNTPLPQQQPNHRIYIPAATLPPLPQHCHHCRNTPLPQQRPNQGCNTAAIAAATTELRYLQQQQPNHGRYRPNMSVDDADSN